MKIIFNTRHVVLTRWGYKAWRVRYYRWTRLLHIHCGTYTLAVRLWD